jgi:deazaflavin-dependent oxidoreductase (nitroreductase family)
MTDDWRDENFCYLTTTGRRTGRPHTIEIWFGANRDTLYLMSGGRDRSDWVRNLRVNPDVRVRVGTTEWSARARSVDDPGEEAMVRRLLAGKYQGWREGKPLSGWAQTALPIGVELGSVLT